MAYIDKDSAIRTAIDMCVKVVGHGITQIDAVDIADAFENIPTADVVKVVRCKDCVNRVEFDTNKFHCELTGYYCGETGYCSDGTPKERGDDDA